MFPKISRIIAIALLSMIGFNLHLHAQDDEVEEYLKPDYGMVTVEYQFSPLNDFPISIENFRLRYFIDYNLALRAGAIIDFGSNKINDTDKDTDARLGIKAGLEFHAEGTKNLSPYVGFELQFVSQGYESQRDNAGNLEITTGGITDGAGGFTDQGSLQFGGTALMGFDLYILKNFYLGAELGLSGVVGMGKDVSFDDGNGTVTVFEDNSSNFRLQVNANNLIRIGYAF